MATNCPRAPFERSPPLQQPKKRPQLERRFHRFAQPADTLAGDEGIVVEAVPWGAADIPARTEYVEAVGLGNRAVDNRRLRIEDLFVHFEFAEVRGLVAESLHRSRIRQGGTQRRHKVVLHLIENTDDLSGRPVRSAARDGEHMADAMCGT